MLRQIAVSCLVIAALAACSPRPATSTEVTPSDAVAAAAATDPSLPACWSFVASRPVLRAPANYTAEAAAFGDDCTTAAVMLVLRDADGASVYTFSSAVQDLLGFELVQDSGTLSAALSDWVGETGEAYMTATSDLPEWKVGATQPMQDDFPFYIEGDLTREQYEALRTAAKPMYCHVQGRESLACLELDPTAPFANLIGFQSLPG